MHVKSRHVHLQPDLGPPSSHKPVLIPRNSARRESYVNWERDPESLADSGHVPDSG
jgi:hypothetical protein